MPFYRTADAPSLGVYQSSGKFHKLASRTADLSNSEDNAVKQSLNLISSDVLKAVAKIYNLSSDINDYIFPVHRAVTADVANDNGDLFEHNELTRFSQNHKCQVYRTFVNDPLHVEHVAFDPKAARGFLPDAHYVTADNDDMHVITVSAVDTTKDAMLAQSILTGELNSVSMGCICDAVRCSECNKVAHSDKDLCDCIKNYITYPHPRSGKIVTEACLGVEFQELSVVGCPADKTAIMQTMLQRAASRRQDHVAKAASFHPIASLLNATDQRDVARYFDANINKLPGAMLRLVDKLF